MDPKPHDAPQVQLFQEPAQRALDAANLGIWELDLTMQTWAHRSPRHDQLFGYPGQQEQWSLAIAERHVLEEDRPALRALFGHAREEGRLRLELRLRWPDGSTHWIELRGSRVNHPADGSERLAGVIGEVTERRAPTLQAQHAQLLEDVFAKAPSFLHVLRGPDHVFELANEAYYRLVGRRDLIGRPAFEAVPEAAHQGYQALLDQVLATGEPFIGHEMEVTLARTPGSPPEQRIVDLVYQALEEPDGQRSRVLGHGTDVTEHVLQRHRAEAALRESQAQLAMIFEGAAVGLSEIAADGRFLRVNPELGRIVGRSPESLVGLSIVDVTHPDDVAISLKAAARVLAHGGSVTLEKRYRRPDGTAVVAQSSLTRLQMQPGTEPRLLAVTVDLTARRQAEAALRESEAKMRAIANLVPDLLWSNQRGGHVDWYNKRWHEYTGLSLSDSTGAAWTATIHPDDLPATQALWQRVLSDPRPATHEHRIRRHDGVYRWHLLRVEPVLNAQGQATRWFGSATDIHEQRTARDVLEQQVRQRTAQLRALLDSAGSAIVATDPDGRITLFNPAAERQFRMPAAQALGQSVAQLHDSQEIAARAQCVAAPPQDPARAVVEVVAQAIHGSADPRRTLPAASHIEWTYVRSDGSRFPGLLSMSLLRQAPDTVVGYMGVITDLSERKALEEALRQRTAELEVLAEREKAIVASARIAVISTDLEGRITSFNPAAEGMFRCAAPQAVGRLVTHFCEPQELTYKAQFFPSDVQAEAARMPAALIAGLLPERARPGEGPRNEWTYMRDDGTSFPGLLHLSVLRDARGQAMGFLVLLTDLTERKALEEQLRERTRQAEVANAAKTAFLANMSHEIRTPMNAIMGLAHLLLRDTHEPLQQQRLGQVMDAARHLLQVINDILDLSKIEAGKMVLEDAEFSLDAVLGRSLEIVRPLAADKGLRLVLDTDDVPGQLRGDATRLSQVLLNLLSNAVKFTDAGSVQLRGELLREDGPRLLVRFEVRDTGCGIPLQRQQAVFDAFEQADGSTTRRHGGTGLGLALVRHLAGLMGGKVGLHSVPGEGSTFWFTTWLGQAA